MRGRSLQMIYLTGGGLTAKTLPVLTQHQAIGVLTQPDSYSPKFVAPFKVWAADNGCFNKGDQFVLEDYLTWLEKFAEHAPRCVFATAPDVVSDAERTWARSRPVFAEIRRRGLWVHMGRVNSLRRLEIAVDFGCDSVDGNYLGFGPDANLPKLLRWLDVLRDEPRLDLWSAA